MDELELKKELNRVPLRYTLPICCLSEKGILFPGNATVTLVKNHDRYFCITNQHVIEEIEKQISDQNYCQIGNSRFSLIETKKFTDAANDLCCFEVDQNIADNFHISGTHPNFIQVPQSEVIIKPDQYVNFGGYPGCFRSKTENGYQFDTFSHGGCLVTSVDHSTFSCLMEKELEEEIESDRRWDELTALGGISGCPVFTWVHDPISRMELAGIIQEGELRLFGSETSTVKVSKIDKQWMDNAASEL